MTAIDVVLVAYRSEDAIEGAVVAARALGGTVVVVDHGDGVSAGLAGALGAVAVYDPSNPGFGTGQNRGVGMTGSPYVLLCNPDAELRLAAIVAGAALLDARPDVAVVQGVIVNQATKLPERSAGVELRPVHLVGRALGARRLLGFRVVKAVAFRFPALRDHVYRVPAGPVEVESLAATAILVRRTAFDAVGGFDGSIFLYGEDLDLCRRLRLAGWTLATVPGIWAQHVSGGSSERAWEREVRWWQGTMRYAARWWGATAWSEAVAAASLRWVRLALRHPQHAPMAMRAMVLEPLGCRAQRREKDRTASITSPICSSST